MAGEVDDIVQNVVLTGNDQVAEAFNKIQEAGTRAFESIEKAGENLSSFSGLAAVLGGLAASISIVGVGLFAFTKETADSVSSMSSLADQAGTTIEQVSGLRAAFAAGGVGAGEMEQAFRHMAITTQQTWAQIKQESREGADKLKGDILSVSQATLALEDAQTKLANVNRDQAVTEKSNANSVAEARLRLAELNGQDVSQQRQGLSLRQARLALDQARNKQADDAASAENERQKAANAAELATISLSQARRKDEDDQKNNISNVIEATKKLVDGDKDALKSINPSVDNLVKGIVGAAGESAHAIGDLKGDITDLSSPAPSAKQALDTLSKALSNLDDNSTKMAVAARFLGRTITQDFLNVLSNPQKLEEFQKRVVDLGLALTDTDKQISEKFRESLFTLQNDIGLVADKIGSAFGPGFTQVLQALDSALVSNKDRILSFADDIAGKAVPVIESFIRVLSGAPDAAKDQWLIDYTNKIGDFGSAVGRLGGIFAQVVGVIVQAAGGIASAINGIFGSNLNGFDVLLGVWVANIIKNFALVVQASASAAAGVEIAFAPVLAGLAVMASAVYVVVKALSALSDAFGLEGQSSHLDAMLEGAEKRLKGIAEFMSGDFKKGMETIKAANAEQAEAEKALDDADKQILDNKKKRQQELVQTSSDVNHKTTEDHKTALDEQDKDHKASVDDRIADLKRLETEAHNSAEKQKSDNVEAAKAAQTAQQPKTTQSSQSQPVSTSNPKQSDGSFTDSAGTRVFPGQSNDGAAVGSTIASSIGQAVAKKLGVPLDQLTLDGSIGFGNARGVRGFQEGPGKELHPPGFQDKPKDNTNLSSTETAKLVGDSVKAGSEAGSSKGVKEALGNSKQQDASSSSSSTPAEDTTTSTRTKADMDAVQNALDKWREIGGELGGVFSKLEPEAADLLKNLSDRSDGSASGVKAASAEQLQRMLDNQRKITDFESQQQKGFGQNIAKQGGTPTLDRTNYSPPVQGTYDQNGNFVPNKVQPPPPASQGAPNPLTFPNYLKDLQDQLSKTPLPATDPRKVDTSSQAYKAQEDTMAKAVERGNLSAAQKEQALPNSDSLNHARNGFGPTDIPPGGIENLPPTPGTFPTPPEQVPLAPELQPFKDLTSVGDKLTGTFDDIGNTLKGALDSFINGLQKNPQEGQGLSDTTFENLKQGLDTLTNALTAKTQEQQAPPQSDTPPPVQDLTDLGNEANGAGTQLADLKAEASSTAEALASLRAAAAAGGVGGSTTDVTPVSAAGGGHIWGPGTETSDSIPALLSKNEFVHPAYAVRHYGLQFMEDIRHLRLPKFNTGGLVGLLSPQLPRFSAGGSVSDTVGAGASSPVPVDLRTDHGTVRVQAQKGALSQLQRAAATKRMTSTTQRRPEFVS